MKFSTASIVAFCALLANGANGLSVARPSMGTTHRSSSMNAFSRTTKLYSASAAIPADASFSNAAAGADSSELNVKYGPGKLPYCF
jgi:hypothetical protein